MTLRHMKIFVAVCKYNSITAAAKKLFLAQPAVSLAIRELETFYGIRLFDRISRRLYITDQGKRLLEYVSHIVALFDDMENRVKNWDNVGTLRVGSSITIGNYLLPGYVEAFKDKYPEIKLQIRIENSGDVEKRIANNELDLAFIEGAVNHPQIIYEKFMEDRLVLFCGRTHPLKEHRKTNLSELIQYDFILREKGSGGRELFDSTLFVHNIKIEPVWESISTQAIIKAVMKGFGLSVLPFLMIKPYLDKAEVYEVEVQDISLKREYNVIYHKNKFLTNSARELIALCKGSG